MLNPYITTFETKVIKRKFFDNKSHIVPKDNLILDYEKLNIEPEDIFINDTKVENIYNSSHGLVLVSSFKPRTSDITIKLDYQNRIKILKLLTTRLLIKSVLNKYFNIKNISFNKSISNPNFHINNMYMESDARNIIHILEKTIKEYINYGIEIMDKKEDNKTTIPALLYSKNLEYTVSNLSEIRNFSISKYEFNKNGLDVYFNVY